MTARDSRLISACASRVGLPRRRSGRWSVLNTSSSRQRQLEVAVLQFGLGVLEPGDVECHHVDTRTPPFLARSGRSCTWCTKWLPSRRRDARSTCCGRPCGAWASCGVLVRRSAAMAAMAESISATRCPISGPGVLPYQPQSPRLATRQRRCAPRTAAARWPPSPSPERRGPGGQWSAQRRTARGRRGPALGRAAGQRQGKPRGCRKHSGPASPGKEGIAGAVGLGFEQRQAQHRRPPGAAHRVRGRAERAGVGAQGPGTRC